MKNLLFSEIYGIYFQTVAEILNRALEAEDGLISEKNIREIVREKAFGESILTIPEALSSGTWPFFDENGRTRVKHCPEMPLTLVEKRWLKSLLSDSRIALFQPKIDGLEDIEPLFSREDVVYFDQYGDGDPFDEPKYREHFHRALTAIKMRQKLALKMIDRKGMEVELVCVPYKIEYSLKDDKFRILGATRNHSVTINIGRITECRYAGEYLAEEYPIKTQEKDEIEILITDERNALERCMLHFSDFEKKTEKLDELYYRMNLRYYREDETEVLIRVLSFGPKIKVVSPKSFQSKIKERIKKQKSCVG